MLEKLKAEVCRANLDLVRKGLSSKRGERDGVDRGPRPDGHQAQPAVPYDAEAENTCHCLARGGKSVEEFEAKFRHGRASILYRHFRKSSVWFTRTAFLCDVWAQACQPLLAYARTQRYWIGDLPCTRLLKPAEIKIDYEANTGNCRGNV